MILLFRKALVCQVMMAQGNQGGATQAMVQVSMDMKEVAHQMAENSKSNKPVQKLQSTSDLKGKTFSAFPDPPQLGTHLLDRFDHQSLWEEKVEMELSQCFPFDAKEYWNRNCSEVMDCYLQYVQAFTEHVLQHGFDAAGLKAYLDVDPVSALRADNLTIVPEPTTLPLALLALAAVPLRVRHG